MASGAGGGAGAGGSGGGGTAAVSNKDAEGAYWLVAVQGEGSGSARRVTKRTMRHLADSIHVKGRALAGE